MPKRTDDSRERRGVVTQRLNSLADRVCTSRKSRGGREKRDANCDMSVCQRDTARMHRVSEWAGAIKERGTEARRLSDITIAFAVIVTEIRSSRNFKILFPDTFRYGHKNCPRLRDSASWPPLYECTCTCKYESYEDSSCHKCGLTRLRDLSDSCGISSGENWQRHWWEMDLN